MTTRNTQPWLLTGAMALAMSLLAPVYADTTINTIVDTLAPLEVVANHGGIRRSIDLKVEFQSGKATLLPDGERQLAAGGGRGVSDREPELDLALAPVLHADRSGDVVGREREGMVRAALVGAPAERSARLTPEVQAPVGPRRVEDTHPGLCADALAELTHVPAYSIPDQ